MERTSVAYMDPEQVFKAQWNGAEAAVKILHDQGDKQKAEFLHEAAMLRALRHPNVVDYFGLAFSEKDEVNHPHVICAMQPCASHHVAAASCLPAVCCVPGLYGISLWLKENALCRNAALVALAAFPACKGATSAISLGSSVIAS